MFWINLIRLKKKQAHSYTSLIHFICIYFNLVFVTSVEKSVCMHGTYWEENIAWQHQYGNIATIQCEKQKKEQKKYVLIGLKPRSIPSITITSIHFYRYSSLALIVFIIAYLSAGKLFQIANDPLRMQISFAIP